MEDANQGRRSCADCGQHRRPARPIHGEECSQAISGCHGRPCGPKAERTAIDILSVRVPAHIVSGYDPASAKERGNGWGERVMSRPAALAVVGALLLLAGCGTTTSFTSSSSSSSPAAGAEPGVSTYLCSGSTSDELLQWRDDSGDLNGTYEFAQLSGQAPSEQVSSNSGELSGTLDGTAITLNIGLSQPLYGSLSGSQLSLNVPQSDGTIQASTCNQSSLSDWNSKVAALGSQASGDNQGANQAAAAQASASASASQEASAQDDVSTLTHDTNLSGDLGQLGSDVQATDRDLGTTRSDAANGNGDQCINASTTVYNDAATTVYNDVLTTVYNDANTLANDIATLRKDIGTVQSDQTALSSAGLSGTPGAGAAVSAAQSAIASAITTANADIDHANRDLSAAYAVADSVGTGQCAGDGPGNSPSGVNHLS